MQKKEIKTIPLKQNNLNLFFKSIDYKYSYVQYLRSSLLSQLNFLKSFRILIHALNCNR